MCPVALKKLTPFEGVLHKMRREKIGNDISAYYFIELLLHSGVLL